MPYIRVKPSSLSNAAEDITRILSSVKSIETDYLAAYGKIDWEVKMKAEVGTKVQHISQRLESQQIALESMSLFLENASGKYMEVSKIKPEENVSDGNSETSGDSSTKKIKTETFGDKLSNAWNDVKDTVVDAAEDVKDTVVDVAEKVKDTVVDAAEGVREAADYVIDGTIHVTKEVWDWVNTMADKLKVDSKNVYLLYQFFKDNNLPLDVIAVFESYIAAYGFEAVYSALQDCPAIEEHYNRNENMKDKDLPTSIDEAESMGWTTVIANCHQNTAPNKDNVKYVSPDGHCEVVFDAEGDVVTDSRDYGTYNYANPRTDGLEHFTEDILPWIFFGNSKDDTTTIEERVIHMVGF